MGSLTPVQEQNQSGFVATRLDFLLNWGRKNSLWPMPLGLSCCGIELMAMIGPKFDISRFGAEAARFSPRQADLMIVAGTLTWKMAQAARTIYDQMPDPKWVIAMGVCSSSGGMYDSYAVVQGIDSILPVDVYVPGCPPRPDAVIDAILKLQKRIELESPTTRIFQGPPSDVVDTGTGLETRQPNAGVSHSPIAGESYAGGAFRPGFQDDPEPEPEPDLSGESITVAATTEAAKEAKPEPKPEPKPKPKPKPESDS